MNGSDTPRFTPGRIGVYYHARTHRDTPARSLWEAVVDHIQVLRSQEGPTMSDPYAETIVPAFTRAPYFEILAPDTTGQKSWRWRFKAGNGEVLAQGEPQMSRDA